MVVVVVAWDRQILCPPSFPCPLCFFFYPFIPDLVHSFYPSVQSFIPVHSRIPALRKVERSVVVVGVRVDGLRPSDCYGLAWRACVV